MPAVKASRNFVLNYNNSSGIPLYCYILAFFLQLPTVSMPPAAAASEFKTSLTLKLFIK